MAPKHLTLSISIGIQHQIGALLLFKVGVKLQNFDFKGEERLYIQAMKRALWEVTGYTCNQAGSCYTKCILKTVAKSRNSHHFDKVVLKECKQDSQAPHLHTFPKNRAVGRNIICMHLQKARLKDQFVHFSSAPLPASARQYKPKV